MNPSNREIARCRPIARCATALALAGVAIALGAAPAWADPPPAQTGCTAAERREALGALQAEVLRLAPERVESLENAMRPGGTLAGWRLPHGHVVLASAGAVAVDNLTVRAPMPAVLLYAPSPATSPADWLDFDGEDGPYRLVGWSHIAPWRPGSTPPARPCVAPGEWLIHEAGWHLRDGSMVLTPDAITEPPRPESRASFHFWHPSVWALHVWMEESGVPTVAFANPRATGGGLALPDDAFYYMVNGRKQRPPKP